MPEILWPDIKRINLDLPEHDLYRLCLDVAKKYGVHTHQIKSKSQKHYLTKVRAEFICRAVLAGHTRQAIGDFIQRDHSTVTGIYQDHKHMYEKD